MSTSPILWTARRLSSSSLFALRFLAVVFASLVATGWTSSPAQANTIFVPSGGNFQAALNTAQPGDTILLEAGGTFIGPFVLPNKPGANWITVRTSAPDTSLPGPNTRITPAYSGVMPKLVSVGLAEPVLSTAPYSHHFRFIGIEFKQASSAAFLYDLILLGDGGDAQNTLDEVPHNIVIDRCYIHAADDGELKRGIALNSASTEIINSHISSFKGVGYDSQAIAGWNGPGPYRIENNYLEGAGENVMFGGATGGLAAQGLIPSDIVIRRNHFRKPLEWRGQWTVKNLLELKNARRVVIDGNLFEGCWADAQVGYAILFTPRPNDSGWAAVVEDVEFTNNTVRQVAAGIHIAGRDSLFSDPNSPRGRRIRVANNLLEIEGWPYDGDGCFLKLGDGANQVTIEHNTILQVGNLTKVWGVQATGFVFRNNLARHNQYGFFGDSAGFGTVALTTYFPGAIFTRNLMTKESGALWNVETFYPAGNFFPDTLDAVGFVNRGAGDYRLASSSAYRGAASDGRDVGCDFAALEAAQTGGGSSPTSTPTPTPTPTPAPTPTPTPTPEGGWTFCANENQRCSFTGTRRTRYGAAGSYNYGTFTDGVDCANSVFGDPLFGVVKRCEYGEAIATPTPTPTPIPTGVAAATFVRTDTTTRGNWQGTYGAQGYQVIGDTGYMPPYAQVTPTGNSSWTWAASTTDARALRKAAGIDRIAATWFADSSFTVEINLTDGQTHRVALYSLDWDSGGRAQTIQVLDAATGAVLDTRSDSGFTDGCYLVWNIRGRVYLRVTRTAGPNAVVSGLFLDAP